MQSTRCAIYARISDDRDHTGLGVTRQLDDCRALAEREGWQIVAELIDNDTSAYRARKRGADYHKLVDLIDQDAVDVVVAWAVDRLHRRPVELEGFIELLERSRTTVVTVTAGNYDLSTPEGRAMARVGGAIAASESERKALRNQRKARELAEAGKVSGGGTRPFGFASDRITVDTDEAALIREATTRVCAGDSLTSICQDWTGRGVTTPTGNPWKLGTLRRMLTSWRIAGIRAHDDEPVTEAVWPAIIDRPTLERVRTILLDPARRTTGPRPRRYPLRGLAVCGRCGAGLVSGPKSNPNGGTIRAYRCGKPPTHQGCGRVSIRAADFEAEVFGRVAARLAGDGLADAIAATSDNGAADDLGAELAGLRERIDVLSADYYERGALGRPEYERRRAALGDRVRAVEASLVASTSTARLTELPTDEAGIVAMLTDRPAAWTRSVLGLVVAEVRVGPAVRGRNRFDPDRVTVTYLA